jgi:Glycosyltransferases involved in cell wall biogenesis
MKAEMAPVDLAPVCVVIPCYNCALTIERAVASVAAQTVLPRQLILVDDCSTDSVTLPLLYELQSRYCTQMEVVVSPLDTNRGPASARNYGWESAREAYVAFLDSDDAWHPEKIAAQYEWMALHQDVVLTCHDFEQLSGIQLPEQPLIKSEIISKKLSPWELMLKNLIATRTVMIRRNIPWRFPSDKRYSEDYQLWLEMAWSGARMNLLISSLAYSFKNAYGEGGLSARMWQMECGELDTYEQLYKRKLISRPLASAFKLFSLFKYFIRLAKLFWLQKSGR